MINWTQEEPEIPGLYLAILRETMVSVGVSVEEFTYPQDDTPPGVYAHSYTGEGRHVSYGWPRGRPMCEDFMCWSLILPYPTKIEQD